VLRGLCCALCILSKMVRPGLQWQEMTALTTIAIAHLLSLPPSSAVHIVPADLLNANNVPRSYAYALSAAGPGVEALGGIKTFSPLKNASASPAQEADAAIESAYHTIGVQAVRPCDEALGAFDIQCMFPVHSLEDLPDPEDDASWRWSASDAAFLSVLRSGFAPLLKILAPRWVSGKRAGYAYVNSSRPDSEPQYVVNRTDWPEAYKCTPWPALSPVLTKLGAALARRIVSRYNSDAYWRKLVPTLKGPPLERQTYANGEAPLPLAGVVISNELNTVTCGPPMFVCADCDTTQWTERCGGEPYTWSSRFWDGTKQQAWDFIASAAHAVKTGAPNVLVGGPELAAGPVGGPKWIKEEWVAGLLNVLANKSDCSVNNCLDFWSFHIYPVKTRPDQEYSMANEIQVQRRLLNNTPFASLPFVVTEFNAAFAYPGTGFMSSAQGAIINAISLIAIARDPLMLGAFLYVGVDGPFQPRDPLSFPLACTPSWKYNETLNCSEDAGLLQRPVPQCFNFSGRYDHDDCSTQPTFNAFGPSGIGAVGINGELKPMAVVMAEFFRPLVGKQVLSDHGRPILTTAWTDVLAVIDDDSTCNAPGGRSSVKLLAAAFNLADQYGKPLADVTSTSDCVDCVSQPAPIAHYLPWMSAEQANRAELRSLSTLSQNVAGTVLSYPVGDAPIFTTLVQLVGDVVHHDVGNGSAINYLQCAYLGEANQLTLAMLSVPGCVDGRPSPKASLQAEKASMQAEKASMQAEMAQCAADKSQAGTIRVVFV